MPYNELRRDYLLDRWVVIATERGRRPTDFAKKETVQARTGVCPFCPGNEHMTPPAVLLYIESDGKIEKEKDEDNFRHKNWIIRCFQNLYPAFTPPMEKPNLKGDNLASAIGHHEVLIESPIHDEHPSDARITQLVHVVNAYLDRLRELSAKSYVRYVSIFRNHGLEAGASLSHAHSQIIATPFIPKLVEEEIVASRKYWKQNGKCVFCDIIARERNGPRLILENSDFVVFAPWASIHPLEFWIIPKKHEATLLDMTQERVKTFAETLKTSLNGLKRLVSDPPYNFGFHLTTNDKTRKHYHWHLEVYPKLAIWAGFEKSTGMYINTVTPEAAAEILRKTISS